jgi:hypothetical protein
MQIDRHPANCYGLKILPISPYNSKILVPTLMQVYCFHRPEGEGVPLFFEDRRELGPNQCVC